MSQGQPDGMYVGGLLVLMIVREVIVAVHCSNAQREASEIP